MENNETIENLIISNTEIEEYTKLIKEVKWHTINYSDISSKIVKGSKIKKNNYKKIENARGKKGIYIFYKLIDDDNIEFIYVGECHTIKDNLKNKKWDLEERLKQHFIIGDKGGLIYKVYKEDKEKCIKLRNKFVENVKLSYFTVDIPNQEILFLESFLIATLKPKYNFMYI